MTLLGLLLAFLFLLLPSLFYLWWMRRLLRGPPKSPPLPYRWPSVSILLPTHQEAGVIGEKLRNLSRLRYPGELEVILVDSGSTDGTLEVARNFVKKGFPWRIRLLWEGRKRGKARALNLALRGARGEVVATSDADAFWEPETVERAVRYLSLPGVGAVTGKEEYLNAEENLWTRAEEGYRRLYEVLRMGESRLHSCLSFQGALAFYRRELLGKFEEKEAPDDTGTALEVCARGYRCLMVPDLMFRDTAPFTLRAFLRVKTRRGLHMLLGLRKAVRLKRRGRLPVGWGVLLANLYLHFVLPLLFPLLSLLFLFSLPRSLPLLLFLLPFLPWKKTRALLVGALLSTFCLLRALLLLVRGKRMISWEKWREEK
jgi:cellulose synthase/poly-beta-1,6-N-acetylglucosamine synthase-like glycosyltransferase